MKLEPGGKNEGENSKGNNNSMGSSGLPYPRFYNGTEDFTAYLKNFNRIATAHNWTPPRCAQILPLYLRGTALAIYELIPGEEKSNWKSLLEGLAKRLIKTSNKETARLKLVERMQEVGESIDEFSRDLKNLAEAAYPGGSFEMDLSSLKLSDEQKTGLKNENEKMAKRFREEICVERFKAGLLPEIKEKVIFMKSPSTLSEAVGQAKKVEELNGTIKVDARKRWDEIEVKEALAEINQVWEINGDENENWGDEQVEPNLCPYYGDEYYYDNDPNPGPYNCGENYDDDQYYYDESQWLPQGNSETWGNDDDQCYDDENFTGNYDNQVWGTDETNFDEY